MQSGRRKKKNPKENNRERLKAGEEENGSWRYSQCEQQHPISMSVRLMTNGEVIHFVEGTSDLHWSNFSKRRKATFIREK